MYDLPESARQSLARGLVDYYDNAWAEGVRGLFDNMAHANMGIITGYLDTAADSYAALRKKSNDAFMVGFQAEVRGAASRYFSNMPDVLNDALPLAKSALESLAKMIPVPVVGGVLAKLVSFAGDAAAEELRARAVARSDEQVTAVTGGEVRKLFSNETEAKQYIDKAIDQYKTVGRFASTIPQTITSFNDAITFPTSVFKVQKAASALNVALVQIRDYIESMQTRLEEVQKVYSTYKATLTTKMPEAVEAVIQEAYEAGYQKGLTRLSQRKPGAPVVPTFTPPTQSGAATQLGAYVAHAMAQGFFDAYPQTRARSGAVSVAPPPLTPPASSAARFHPRRG